MISRVQTIPRVKLMKEVIEELRNLDTRKEIIAKRVLTSLNSKKEVHSCIFDIIYVNDKICMATLREILDMNLLFKVLASRLSFLDKEHLQTLALKWFHSENPIRDEKQSTKIKPAKITQFVNFNQKQENKILDSEVQNPDGDNLSHSSDFSLDIENFRKIDINFFDF